MKQKLLLRQGKSGRIYLLVRYRTMPNGVLRALKKFDVTEEFEHLEGYRDAVRKNLYQVPVLRRGSLANVESKKPTKKRKKAR